jgi:hypothetical protein
MNNFSKLNRLFLFLILWLGAVPLWAGPADWSFMPASMVFKPLIGEPREPLLSLVGYLNKLNYEGNVGGTLEIVRYSPRDDLQFGWGLFALGDILLGENGAYFPMLDGDYYIGTYFSGNFGVFSARLEALHESTHLGDSFYGTSQVPLFDSKTINYSRENANMTLSFQPSEWFRFYAGAGIWDIPLYSAGSNEIFTSIGTEIYSPYWAVDSSSMRGYLTGSLQWIGDTGVWDKEVQLGIQWKSFKNATRALRIALLFYSGNSQFGQFYNQFDEHLALATFFDF